MNSFCSACGTTLLLEPSAFPEMIGCVGGCFAEVPLPEPTLSTSDDLRCAWLNLPEGWAKRTAADAVRSAEPR